MGLAAGAAGVLFGISIGALAAFFATRNERFDRVSEWAFVAFAVAAILTMLTVGPLLAGGVPATALTAIGVTGVAVIGVGELAVALRLVDFRRVSAVITAGFLAFLAWVGGVSLLLIDSVQLATLGWLGLAAIAVGTALVGLILATPGVLTGAAEPDPRLMTAFFVPMAGIVVWLIWLGTAL
ncbi:MAG TPA: hypothetical protein VFK54_10755 [Candidatus Limnocylindrales bacterium]|nr:hypothetical protein [Candidatus Limnocylindrales bacterium]